ELAVARAGTIQLTSLPDRKQQTIPLDSSAKIVALHYDPSGKLLAAATDVLENANEVSLWDVPNPKRVRVLTGFLPRQSSVVIRGRALCSPNGRYLGLAQTDSGFSVQIVGQGPEPVLAPPALLGGLGGPATSALLNRPFWPDLMVWDVQTGELVSRVTLPERGDLPFAFSPDNQRLAYGDGSRLCEVAVGARQPSRIFQGHNGSIQAVAYHPSRTVLLAGGADLSIRVWELVRGGEVTVLRGHGGGVNHLAFSDEDQLVSCGNIIEASEIKLWNLSSRLATTERLDSR